MRILALAAAAVAAGACGASAGATMILADVDVRNPTLTVSAQDVALVQYTTADGRRRHVLLWGAQQGFARSRTATASPRKILGGDAHCAAER